MKSKICFAVVLFALGLSVSGCVNGIGHAEAKTFRVMTYNIHHGEGLDGKIDLARIAALIQRERVDIVALQEVDKGVARTGRRDFPAELSRLTGLQCVFSNNYSFQGGEYGNAVLTRFPVLTATNHLFHMLKARESRGLLQLTLQIQGQAVQFWNTHLDAGHDDAERWSSLAELSTLAATENHQPFLLCGDFNAPPTNRIHQKLRDQFDDSWAMVGSGEGCTVPAAQPNRRIDYLWIGKNQRLNPISARVISSDASDHLPVLVEFELRSAPATHP